jgi:hypothetical protein
MLNLDALNNELTYCGFKVIINPFLDSMPKMQLSPAICKILDPDFVYETNNWMRNFFGVDEEKVIMGRDPLNPEQWVVFMGRKTEAKFREQIVNIQFNE